MSKTPVSDQVGAVREGCGLLRLESRALFSLEGADRLTFLHGQCTNKVKDLSPGEGRTAFVLDNRGHNHALIRYLIEEDRILLDTELEAGPSLEQRLSKYMVIEDVSFRSMDDAFELLLLAGPEARRILIEAVPDLDPPTTEGSFARVDSLLAVTDRETGEEGFVLWARPADRTSLWESLTAAGAVPISTEAYDILRTEAGRPWRGRDFGEDCLPEETGQVERTVSFSKGCYLGQEPVAMQHYRGKPRKMIRGLLFDAPGVRSGAEVLIGDSAAGTIGTVHESPTLERTIALALLKGNPEPGTQVRVTTEKGQPAVPGTVTELPFVDLR